MSSQTDSGTSADAAILHDSFRSSACEQVASAGAARVHAHSPKMHQFVYCGSLLNFSAHAAEACSFGELPRSTASGWQGPAEGLAAPQPVVLIGRSLLLEMKERQSDESNTNR